MKWPRFFSGLIIVLALILHMRVIMPSGSHYCAANQCGIFFWGAHEHDAVWHLALAGTSFAQTPPALPNYAGTALSGYNALLDQVLSGVARITHIPASILYFKIIPILWFAILTYLLLRLSRKLSTNPWLAPFLLFFVYFGNSFSYFLSLWHDQTLAGASGLLSMQAPQTLTNIQFALSLPLLTYLLIGLRDPRHTMSKHLVLALVVFFMLGLKFYGGAIGALLVALYYVATRKENGWRSTLMGLLILLLATGLSIWLFYNPGQSTGAVFSLSPLSTIRPIIEEPALVYLPSIATMRYVLYSEGVGPKVLLIEAFTLIIFVVMNFGMRLLGLITLVTKRIERTFSHFDLVVAGGILGSLLLNMLLVQRGEWWNTIQFLYYGFFLLSIYAAQFLADLLHKKRVAGIVLTVLTVLLTIPNALDTWKIFASFPPRSYISDEELLVLSRLRDEPAGVILALPLYPAELPAEAVLAPLHSRYDTAYVSAYSGKPTYLNDLVQLRLTGTDYLSRERAVLSNLCLVLDEVAYVYVAGDPAQALAYATCSQSLELITENRSASLYRVTR